MNNNVPDNLFYTREHEWVRIEGNLGTVGITDYAQSSLGDITFVELPETGEIFKQNSVFISIESVKAASDIYMPLSGKVVKVNDVLSASPEKINQSPYSEGWLVQIEITDENEKSNLMSNSDYCQYLEQLSK
ncbi:glycine cleavage system protein GcvH [bacterium]|nr:glycine cleavage system protein GcvH [bacterium]